MSDFNKVIDYLENNHQKFLEELTEFLRFESISTKNEYQKEVVNCANWLEEHLKSIGLQKVWQNTEFGNPLVLAEHFVSENKPTILLYGHYDVQPVDPVNLWDSPPFAASIRDGKIFARGVADDKGQVFMQIKVLEAFIKVYGTMPVNIKIIYEGEEESGSEAIERYVENFSSQLKSDAVLVSDTGWFSPELPSITYALRGIVVFEMILRGPNRDLHSGMYGGAIGNPLIEISKIIAQLFDTNGKIAVPGLYDNVLPITEVEKAEFALLPFDKDAYLEDLGVEGKGVGGENNYSILEKVWMRPALGVNGLFGGYIEQGHKSIIPSQATAKISMRIVPNQTVEEVVQKVRTYIESLVPKSMQLEFIERHGANPVIIDRSNPYIQKALLSLEKSFQTKAIFMREGGSIPIVGLFTRHLEIPVVLMGFGLDSDNIHSPNEHLRLKNFFGGLKAIACYLNEISLEVSD